MAKLNLSAVHEQWHHEIQDHFDRGDPGLLWCLDSHRYLQFFLDNLDSLRSAGMFESVFLGVFTGCKINNHYLSEGQLTWLFFSADREKFIQAGDALPDGERFEVYRGVAGTGNARHIHGFSWTTDFDIACWFALRYSDILPNPTVYRATVPRHGVYAYVDHEKEIITYIHRPKRMALSLDEIQAGRDRHSASIRRHNAAIIQVQAE